MKYALHLFDASSIRSRQNSRDKLFSPPSKC